MSMTGLPGEAATTSARDPLSRLDPVVLIENFRERQAAHAQLAQRALRGFVAALKKHHKAGVFHSNMPFENASIIRIHMYKRNVRLDVLLCPADDLHPQSNDLVFRAIGGQAHWGDELKPIPFDQAETVMAVVKTCAIEARAAFNAEFAGLF